MNLKHTVDPVNTPQEMHLLRLYLNLQLQMGEDRRFIGAMFFMVKCGYVHFNVLTEQFTLVKEPGLREYLGRLN